MSIALTESLPGATPRLSCGLLCRRTSTHRMTRQRCAGPAPLIRLDQWTGRLFKTPSFRSLADRLQAENLRQDVAKDVIPTVRITAILITTVVTIFITATEALAEVVVVVVLVYVIAAIAVVGIP